MRTGCSHLVAAFTFAAVAKKVAGLTGFDSFDPSRDDGRAVFWDLHPFPVADAAEQREQQRQEELLALSRELDEREAAADALEKVLRAQADERAQRRRELESEREALRKGWAMQERSLMYQAVFRLIRMHAAAAGLATPHASDRREARSIDHHGEVEESHAQWEVHVVTCLPPPNFVAGEIPVHDLFRSSTSLPVTDLCEGDTGPTVQLDLFRRVVDFLNLHRHTVPGLVYLVSDCNVFFNEAQGARDLNASRRAARIVSGRYTHVIHLRGAETVAPVVAATETICRSGDWPCAAEDAVGGPFLHAGGLVGFPEALEDLLTKLLILSAETGETDANTLLRFYHHWRPDVVVPDDHELLFGSFAVALPGPCNQSNPRTFHGAFCAPEPCCPIGSDFELLHHFYDKFLVEGCIVRAHAGTVEGPVSWHGDGVSKWLYLLAVQKLATTCQTVAQSILRHHPADMLEYVTRHFVVKP